MLPFPSPRQDVLDEVEAARELNLTKAADLEQAMEALRLRYHGLVDRWVDAEAPAKALKRGALLLAAEAAWRKRGRPVHEFAVRLAAIDASVEEDHSLRALSFAVADLRCYDEDLSIRLAWAASHPTHDGSDGTDRKHMAALQEAALGKARHFSEALSSFDVESAAALRKEVEKEAEQLRVLLSWKAAGQTQQKPGGGGGGGEAASSVGGGSADGDEDDDETRDGGAGLAAAVAEKGSPTAQQDRLDRLDCQVRAKEDGRVTKLWARCMHACCVRACADFCRLALRHPMLLGSPSLKVTLSPAVRFCSPRLTKIKMVWPRQVEVLQEFITAAGGWRAAVVPAPGLVNVDAHLEYALRAPHRRFF